MPSGSELVSILIGVVIAAAALGVLHVIASSLGQEKHLHDLRVRVNTLRNLQFERMKRQHEERGGGGFEIVDDHASLRSAPGKKAA